MACHVSLLLGPMLPCGAATPLLTQAGELHGPVELYNLINKTVVDNTSRQGLF
jgi:hypothetical protein